MERPRVIDVDFIDAGTAAQAVPRVEHATVRETLGAF